MSGASFHDRQSSIITKLPHSESDFWIAVLGRSQEQGWTLRYTLDRYFIDRFWQGEECSEAEKQARRLENRCCCCASP